MRVIKDPAELQTISRSLQADGNSVGVVPTMGALHAGHMSLVERARSENDIVIVTLFVNPTQFNDPGDLEAYPSTWENDCVKLKDSGTDILFAPRHKAMYPDNYAYRITERDLSAKYCGTHREGHFDGVLTVVMKLLNSAAADRAYFGEKDWQQLILVRRMTEAFFIPTEIVACPTVREPSGLAMSSRNRRLTESELKKAPELYNELVSGHDVLDMKRNLESRGFVVEYIEEFSDPVLGDRLLAAAHLGNVRLIDNVKRIR